jgi:hypothetical protein
MINDLTQTLINILNEAESFEELKAALVTPQRPSDDVVTSDTVNLFLYDIREHTELRSNERYITRLNGLSSISRNPLRFACSYLVTVRCTGGSPGESELKEQRILAQALSIFSGMSYIAEATRKGELKKVDIPIPLMTAQPNLASHPTDFWNALGIKLRPAFVVTAVIPPFDTSPAKKAYNVRTAGYEVKPIGTQIEEKFFLIGGYLRDHLNIPIPNATISIDGRVIGEKTDLDGRFSIPSVTEGNHTIRADLGDQSVKLDITVPADKTKTYDLKLTPTSIFSE